MRAHHIFTIFAICFVVGVLADSKRPSIVTTAVIWLFQSTTEQPVFVALLTCRCTLLFSYKAVDWELIGWPSSQTDSRLVGGRSSLHSALQRYSHCRSS